MALTFLDSGLQSPRPSLPVAIVHLVLSRPITAGEPAQGSRDGFVLKGFSVSPSSCRQPHWFIICCTNYATGKTCCVC